MAHKITDTDLALEAFYSKVAERPQRKFEETITTWDRRVYWYDKDEVGRQQRDTDSDPRKATYEDHRIAVETAVAIFGKTDPHNIAMEILSHRHFRTYRAKAFGGIGSFNSDYGFILKKISVLFNPHKAHVIRSTAASKLAAMQPGLVQVNHIIGSVEKVKLPSSKPLEYWLNLLNSGAPESTTYVIVK